MLTPMQSIDTILSRIKTHCAARGIAETTFGRFVVNDGKFVSRLRAGGSMTLRTLERLEGVLGQPEGSQPGRPRRAKPSRRKGHA